MSDKIIDFTKHSPEALFLATLKEKAVRRQGRQHQHAVSLVRRLVEAVEDLMSGSDDEFTRGLVADILPRLQEALDNGCLEYFDRG